RILLPAALYPDRKNSRGIDFSDESALSALEAELAVAPPRSEARPLLGGPEMDDRHTPTSVANPANRDEPVGRVTMASVADAERPDGVYRAVEFSARDLCRPGHRRARRGQPGARETSCANALDRGRGDRIAASCRRAARGVAAAPRSRRYGGDRAGRRPAHR